MTHEPETIAKQVLTEAARWIGTPYRHGASSCGVSCDCLGLIRGVWRTIYGCEPEAAKPYAADWAEVSQADPLMDAARRHLQPRPSNEPLPGDLLVFRWRDDCAAKHLGIMAHDNRFIHAYEGHAVLASALVPQWRKRIVGIFMFPERNKVSWQQ